MGYGYVNRDNGPFQVPLDFSRREADELSKRFWKLPLDARSRIRRAIANGQDPLYLIEQAEDDEYVKQYTEGLDPLA